MDLLEWLEKNNISQADIARKLNVFPNQINNILRAKHKPSLKLAQKIKEFTNDEVTYDDLFSIKPPESPREKIMKMIVTDADIKEVIKQKIVQVITEVLKEESCQSHILELVNQYAKGYIICESDCKKEAM